VSAINLHNLPFYSAFMDDVKTKNLWLESFMRVWYRPYSGSICWCVAFRQSRPEVTVGAVLQ